MSSPRTIAVIGGGEASPAIWQLAYAAGQAVARHDAVLICGGLGGTMAAAARGARSAGGITIGILPGYDRSKANPDIEFAIATGMGHARNVIVVATADAIVALAGQGGTLSEIGLALAIGRPVVGLGAWHELEHIAHATDAAMAVELALAMAAREARAD